MLQSSWRQPVAKIIEPIAKLLIKSGLSANLISVSGGLGSTFSALYFFPKGNFLPGVIAVVVFALFDLFDGTVARLSPKGSSKWGALLDSTLDRISDIAILVGGMLYFQKIDNSLTSIFLIAISSGFMVSYVKARAEALNIKCDGGIAERTERLIIILGAYLLSSFGVSNAVEYGIYFLSLLSVITVVQRLVIVYRGSK